MDVHNLEIIFERCFLDRFNLVSKSFTRHLASNARPAFLFESHVSAVIAAAVAVASAALAAEWSNK